MRDNFKLYILLYLIIFITLSLSSNVRVNVEDFTSEAEKTSSLHKCQDNDTIYGKNIYGKFKKCDKLNLVGKINRLDCSKDTFTIDRWSVNKKEKGKFQNVTFDMTTYYSHVYSTEKNLWDVYLFQKVQVDPGKMNVNNVKEHLAFYNTKLFIKNQVSLYNISLGVRRVESYPIDSDDLFSIDLSSLFNYENDGGFIGEYLEGANNFVYKLINWSTKTEHTNDATQWKFHLRWPFNTIEETPSNFHQWMRKRLYWKSGGGYVSYKLPISSTDKFDAYTFNHFEIYSRGINISDIPVGSFKIQVGVDHYLGDLIVGSSYPDHNAYREIKYSTLDNINFHHQ